MRLRRAQPRAGVAESAAAATVSAPPARIANPRRAQRPDVAVWVLRASPACELTREFLHNRRYRTEEAVALPAVGCSLADCRCRYEPVTESRRRERHHTDDRRDAVRFESRTDRRGHQERRNNDVWQHGSLR